MVVSIKEIREKCKKQYWGPVHKFYHEIGFYFTKPFVNTSITPNQITVLWIIIQVIGGVLLSFGTYKHMLIGILVYHFGFFIDCIDGNLARYRGASSWKGIYLEQIAHHITITFLFIGLTIGVYRIIGNVPLFIVGIIGTLSFLFDKIFAVNIYHFSSHAGQSNKSYNEEITKHIKKSNLKSKSKLITNIFAFLRVEHPGNLLFFLLLFGMPHIALAIYSLMFFIEMVRKLNGTLLHLGKIDKLNKSNRSNKSK